jgi:hypothetical protein
MAWLALLLIGIGVCDLLLAAWPHGLGAGLAWAPGLIAAGVAAAVGSLGDLRDSRQVLAMTIIGLAVLLWGLSLIWADTRPWLALTVLAVSVLTALALSPGDHASVAGPIGRYLNGTPVPVLQVLGPDRALLILGVGLVQLATGNTIVRLVLAATGTNDPRAGHDSAQTLRGGRLLGPMERLVIVGFGLAGSLTAASIVIAAKGLLRFPELQAHRRGRRGGQGGSTGPGIDAITEYFLVGSFVSWLIAMACLVLLAQPTH